MFACRVDHPDDYDLMVLSGPAGCRADRVNPIKILLGKTVGSLLHNLPIEDLDDTAVTRDRDAGRLPKRSTGSTTAKIPAGLGRHSCWWATPCPSVLAL